MPPECTPGGTMYSLSKVRIPRACTHGRGELAQFIGISAAYEVPADPALAIDRQAMAIQDCRRLILERVRHHP